MRLHLLGTGVPEPSMKRMSSSYLIRTGKDVMLFDHGPGAYYRLMELGVDCTEVTHVFITHLHYDHCADLVSLFLNRWDVGAGNIPPLKIYGPPGTQQFVDRLFGPEGAFALDLKARCNHWSSVKLYEWRGGKGERALPDTEVTELAESDVVEGDGWRLTLANVPHMQPYLVCYGFRLESPEGVFAYSGDAAPCKAMHMLAHEADVLVHMCIRLTETEIDATVRNNPKSVLAAMPHMALAELARDAGVKTLVASHFPPGTDRDGMRERTIADMHKVFDGTLIWGEDLMEIPFDRE
ncbi:MAG: MBL fold metallo-hydrolase [Rhodospirillales bacterium]|nr:MBL fold metallo-hydrolase [Rhodospirillales bacterium]